MKTAVAITVLVLGFSLFILARAQEQGVGGGADGTMAHQPPFHDDPQQALADAKGRCCCIVLCIGARG
jgi:hypothetical protein